MQISVENTPRFIISLSEKEIEHLTQALRNVNRTKVHEHVEDFIDKFLKKLLDEE